MRYRHRFHVMVAISAVSAPLCPLAQAPVKLNQAISVASISAQTGPTAPAAGNNISFRRVVDDFQFQAPAVSYDGRYISHQFGSGTIMVRELATGKDYTLNFWHWASRPA